MLLQTGSFLMCKAAHAFIRKGCGSTQWFLCVSPLLHAGAMLAYTKAWDPASAAHSFWLRKLIFKLFRRVRLSVVLLQAVVALKLDSGSTLDLPAVHALLHRLEYVDTRQVSPVNIVPECFIFTLAWVPFRPMMALIILGWMFLIPTSTFTNSVHCWWLSLSWTTLSPACLRIASRGHGTSVVIDIVPSSSLLESFLRKPRMASGSTETSPRTLCVSIDVEAALCNSTLMLL